MENGVGFLRRNLMVPGPGAASLQALDETLMALRDALATTTHTRRTCPCGELFAQDVTSLLRRICVAQALFAL